jgi:cell wall-associated NlpC family hydrolase
VQQAESGPKSQTNLLPQHNFQTHINGAFVTNPEIDRWERVALPRPGDGILFAMTQDDAHTPGLANHAGVYLSHTRFLHHFAHRLSCEAELDAFWRARITAFMRWKG